jgi:tetratricopeptide (TPR) repeat protein
MQRRVVDWGWIARALVIVLAGLWIYWPVLRGEWIWDDSLLVTDNKVVQDSAGLWKIWFQPACMSDYQPLKFSVVWLQWHLWGENTLGYHLTNVALHLVSSFLVWRLLAKLGMKLAWLGGLVFAVHPLQVESVAWISELKNTLSLPPFLLAMCAYVDFDESRRWRDHALALAWFLVAMLCKSTMVMFPFVILLYAWWKRGRLAWSDVRASAPFFAVSLVLGLATLEFTSVAPESTLAQAAAVGFSGKLLLTGGLIGFYVAKFFWPVPLSATYPAWDSDPGSLLSYGPWLALAAVLACGWRWRAEGGRGAILGLGFFLINLVPPVGFLVGHYPQVVFSLDHLVYLPMLGLVALVVAGLGMVDEKCRGLARLFWILPTIAALTLLAQESRAYAGVFAQAKTLWMHTLRYDPASVPALLGWGEVLSNEGKAAEAADQYRIALRIAPQYAKAHYDLANRLVELGDTTEATEEYEEALKIDPGLRQAHINLGIILQDSGRNAEAVDHFQEAVKLDPEDPKAHLSLGVGLREAGRLDEAEEEYQQAAELAPADAEPHHRLAELALQRGQAAEALAECDAALQLKPDFADCYFIRGNVELYSDEDAAATDDFSKAIGFDRHLADAYFRRGTLRQMQGDLTDALADLQEGCRQAPKDNLADYARLSIWVLQAQMGREGNADHDLTLALGQSWNASAGDWVTELARFLLGQVKEADLLTQAATASPGNDVLTCEAWYFAGMKALGGGDRAKAVSDLQKCAATGQRNSIKYRLAQAQLLALGVF